MRRHPVLTGLWLVMAIIWLLAAIAADENDLFVSVLTYLVIMTPITLVILGLGQLSDRIRTRRDGEASTAQVAPVAPSSSVAPTSEELASQRRALDQEARQQRQMALDLKEREEALRQREELLLAQPLPPLPDPKVDPVRPTISLDRTAILDTPARYCFGCGAWFGRPEDDTCRVCGAPRVGAEA